jgi:hypothetical protein
MSLDADRRIRQLEEQLRRARNEALEQAAAIIDPGCQCIECYGRRWGAAEIRKLKTGEA